MRGRGPKHPAARRQKKSKEEVDCVGLRCSQ